MPTPQLFTPPTAQTASPAQTHPTPGCAWFGSFLNPSHQLARRNGWAPLELQTLATQLGSTDFQLAITSPPAEPLANTATTA